MTEIEELWRLALGEETGLFWRLAKKWEETMVWQRAGISSNGDLLEARLEVNKTGGRMRHQPW